MVRLQCPHWAPAAPAPQLSSPSVHRGASSAFSSTGLFSLLPNLNGWGCDLQDSTGLRRTSWSVVTPSLGAIAR